MTIDNHNIIARNFSKAAVTYDQGAWLQRDTGRFLLEELCGFKKIDGPILDFGCGTGWHLSEMRHRYSQSDVFGLDLSFDMVKRALMRLKEANQGLLVGDIVQFPFKNAAFGMLFGNFVLQWLTDWNPFIFEASRVLQSNGLLAISTLGSQTLWELDQSFQYADSNGIHIHRYDDPRKWITQFVSNGFELLKYQQIHDIRHYDSVRALAMDLKNIGAHYMGSTRRRTLTGPSRWKKMEEFYEKKRTVQGIPATYDVHYLVLKKC